jgi:hypothetical protein
MSPQSKPRTDRTSSRSARWLVLFFVVALVVRWIYARHGALVYDEYQHLHAAFLVAGGLVPYRDFFEHHSPLLYYVLAALLDFRAPSFDTLIHARYLSSLVHLATVGIAVLWAWRRQGKNGALLAAALLLGNMGLFVWGTRTYLDTWAAPLLLLGAWALPAGAAPVWRPLLSGVFLGTACLVTQKAVFVAPAAVLVLLLRRAGATPPRAWWKDMLLVAGGALLPLVLLAVHLGAGGSAGMLRDAFLLNTRWRARHFPTRELLILGATDGPIYFAALAGVVWRVRGCVRRRAIGAAEVPVLFLLSLGAGIFLAPVVWEEYFVLLLPFAVLVAADMLRRIWRWHVRREPQAWPSITCFFGAMLAILAVTDLIGLHWMAGYPISRPAALATILAWIVFSLLALRARRRAAVSEPLLWLAALLALPVIQQIDWTPRHRNDAERRRVEYVLRHTTPQQAVFDGRSGWGVFRPHAYRYWFLHDEMQLMLTEREKTGAIVAALRRPSTQIAIIDDYVRLLPPVVLETIRTEFEPTPFKDVWIRRR